MTWPQRGGLSPEAKARLATVVRALRERLLKDLGDAVQSTYRLVLKPEAAGLDEEEARRRARREAWFAEQVRSGGRAAKETDKEARDRHRGDAVKRAAATLLNRLVVLRQAETLGTRVKVLTSAAGTFSAGWRTRGPGRGPGGRRPGGAGAGPGPLLGGAGAA